MTKLYDSQVAQILPDKLAEIPEVEALSFAIAKGMQKMIEYCWNISVYAEIDCMPEYALDLLAVELDTQYYDTSLDIDSKRRLVKGTLVWYMSAGTPSAVEELVTAVFGEGQISEWYEYGGNPYYFKILTNAFLTPDLNAMFAKMIKRVKNTRSHLEAIEIHRSLSAPVRLGVSCITNNNLIITNSPQRSQKLEVNALSNTGAVSYPNIIINNRR